MIELTPDSKILLGTVGLPRSGKSTEVRKLIWPMVNPDSIRLALHGHQFIGLAEDFVWAAAKLMVRSLFLAGHHVVVLDATNTTMSRRDVWTAPSWTTVWWLFDTTSAECVRRAGSDGLLAAVIKGMSNKWEPLAPDELQADPDFMRQLRRLFEPGFDC
jgi:predicted kinase